jgi:hypothetical protein
MNKIYILSLIILLAGCAMSPSGYNKIGNNLAMLQQCFVKGYISSDTAAAGKFLMQKTASTYTYDSNKMNLTTQDHLSYYSNISAATCSSIEVEIKTAYMNQQHQQSIPVYQAPKSTTTNCYKFGQMVQCNSY